MAFVSFQFEPENSAYPNKWTNLFKKINSFQAYPFY